MNYYIELNEELIYHVFSRAIGDEKMFKTEVDFISFKQKLTRFLDPVVDIIAYSFIPNHFHLLIKIKTLESIKLHAELEGRCIDNLVVSDYVVNQFSRCLNSYTKTFNIKNLRKGALFINRFRRVEITDESHFCAAVFYIHKNAVHHGLTSNIMDWPYCSYPALINKIYFSAASAEIMEYFGSFDKFKIYHEQEIKLKSSMIKLEEF